jgi:hypothetical protein
MIHRIPHAAALALLCLSVAHAASISAPTYTFVSDSTPPNYDLSAPGDTNKHTVHLYGFCANTALLNLQFSN